MHIKEKLTPTLLKPCPKKLKRGGKLSNSFYDSSITLIPQQGKVITQKEKYRPIYLMIIDAKPSTYANQLMQYTTFTE